ncbi:mucoidy inhibitor MuiA family protein [Dolichospermum sp. ST_sed10]|nr:mucoidy inhibitor MuiA family protein [Dolichospermum sp. ST_sed10]
MVNPETPFWQKPIDSQIVAVTVYSDQALVTRRALVSLSGGERELVITPLPVTLEVDSIRVSGVGTAVVKLLGVSSDRLQTTEPIGEKVTQLTGQIQQIETQKRHLQAQIDALSLQTSFIVGLREKTEDPFSQSLARKNISLSETLDFINFLGSQYCKYAIAVGECKAQLPELEKQLQTVRAVLQKVQTPQIQESLNVIVGVEVQQAGEFELEIAYMIPNASWYSLYDLRVNNPSDGLHLSYLAEITQSTGENWLGVELTLSTAKPGHSTLPPQLKSWYIDVPMARMEEIAQRSMPYPAAMALPMPFRTPAKPVKPEIDEDFLNANETVVTANSHQKSVVTLKFPGEGKIPSDGTPHKITICQEDYPCCFEYVAIPKLASFAYLQVHVKNNINDVTLLPGTANIFRNHNFVGTTKLENILPGEEFKLNLGIDKGLKIERDLVELQVDKKLMSNQRRVTYAYRLIITNLLNQSANLQLTEQLPISRSEHIQVYLVESKPEIQQTKTGILSWLLTIAPQEQQEIYYQFTVEHPPEVTVVGLDI